MNGLPDALIAIERYWESSAGKHQHGWVNGRQYEPTEERFGILTVPEDGCLALNFLPWSQHAEQPKGQMGLLWLAERQRTRYVDWHTQEERSLFRKPIAADLAAHARNSEPDFVSFAKGYSAKADGEKWSTHVVSSFSYAHIHC